MDTSTDIANALDRDIAALKAKVADFDAQHQLIDKVTWPQGVRIAVNFTADFDAMLLRRGSVLAAGPIEKVFTARNLSRCFGVQLEIEHRQSRWTARAR